MGKRKTSKEESLFNTEDLDFDLPPSPLVQEERRRRAKELERQREHVRTQDEHAASASDLMAEWVQYLKTEGLSDTDAPAEIKARVGRSMRSLIKKGYTYEEIVFALRTFTVRDLRNRKYIPKIGNLEVYARQWRGENVGEKSASDAEQERLRREAIARGQVPSSGTERQNRRDATLMAIRAGSMQLHEKRQAALEKGGGPKDADSGIPAWLQALSLPPALEASAIEAGENENGDSAREQGEDA